MLKYIFALIILLALLLVGVTVGANNDQIIVFNYIIAQMHIRLSTLVAILFGLGLILGWFISSFFYIKLKIQHISVQRQLKKQTDLINRMAQKTVAPTEKV